MRNFIFIVVMAAAVSFGGAVKAQEIRYVGDGTGLATADDGTNGGAGTAGSLLPGSSASDNTIAVEYVAVPGTTTDPARVYGGISSASTVSNNTVDFVDGAVPQRIYGGFARGTGNDAVGNNVYFKSGFVGVASPASRGRIYGGHSEHGNAVSNIVAILGGEVFSGYAVGGFANAAGNGDAIGNRVILSGGTVGALTIAGWTNGTGIAAENSVEMTGGQAADSIYGGYSAAGSSFRNTIRLTGGIAGNDVMAGFIVGGAGDAADNRVVVDGTATVAGNVYGGYHNAAGNAVGNSVTVHNGAVGATTGNELAGGYSRGGDAVGNKATIYGGTVNIVSGGSSFAAANVADNAVAIYGGTFKGSVQGGAGPFAAVTGNSVEIHGGVFEQWVYGGYSSGGGNVTNNAVVISGGTYAKALSAVFRQTPLRPAML